MRFASSLLFGAVLLLLSSCAQTPPRVITYRLNDSYTSARDRIASFHRSQQRNFSLVQDQIISRTQEISPGEVCQFSLQRYAFDIGNRPIHRSQLSKSGAGSIYRVTEDGGTELYTLPALLKLNPPPQILTLDSWVKSNLSVQQRTDTADR